jgi:ubiquinone/menaquinone biosynthesis C-methylase UbiE
MAKVTMQTIDWGVVASTYDTGRPLPAAEIEELLKQNSLLCQRLTSGVSLVEVGAGTGRVLVPLARLFPRSQVIGIDNSPKSLDVLRARAEALGVSVDVMYRDLSDGEPLPVADMYLCSSVLHAVKEWRGLLSRIAQAVPSDGVIILLGEEGDIYNLALSRSPHLLPAEELDPLLLTFWGEYHRLRAEVEAPPVEQTQIGCAWEAMSAEAFDYCSTLGFRETFRANREWIGTHSPHSLLKLIEDKAFSSIIALSDAHYAHVLRGLRALVEKMAPSHTARARYLGIARSLERTVKNDSP